MTTDQKVGGSSPSERATLMDSSISLCLINFDHIDGLKDIAKIVKIELLLLRFSVLSS